MSGMPIKFPALAQELAQLLSADQREVKALARQFFHGDKTTYEARRAELRRKTAQRAKRMLQILDAVGEPSLSNIGSEGALAMSVLATHAGGAPLRAVLEAFEQLYGRQRSDCRYQSIPAMHDWVCISERRPQRFGTQWMFDKNNYPFLPVVEDFEHVNDRRREYGLEPLRWPKSLAIPEAEQPWLARPIEELTMREPTEGEYGASLG